MWTHGISVTFLWIKKKAFIIDVYLSNYDHFQFKHDRVFFFTEPVSMSLVMAVTAGGVAFLLLFLTILVYLIRSEKMCFSRKYSK